MEILFYKNYRSIVNLNEGRWHCITPIFIYGYTAAIACWCVLVSIMFESLLRHSTLLLNLSMEDLLKILRTSKVIETRQIPADGVFVTY